MQHAATSTGISVREQGVRTWAQIIHLLFWASETLIKWAFPEARAARRILDSSLRCQCIYGVYTAGFFLNWEPCSEMAIRPLQPPR